MKANQNPIPMYDKNDAVLANTLGKLYKLMWMPPPNSKAKQQRNEKAMDQAILHLLAAPDDMLASC
jgi:hypothetical protein